MRFEKAKTGAITQYLLEKIAAQDPRVVQSVSAAFSIDQSTVHRYLKELLSKGVIRRAKRGRYELVTTAETYTFLRSRGELEEEQRIYNDHLFSHFSNLSNNIRYCWDYILGEMINNVIDHSQAETLLVTVQQNYLKTFVFIKDDGIGIFKKIRDHFGLSSLDDAICELFKGKLTTDPDHHSGEGIFFSSRMADEFLILSDEKLFTIDKFDKDTLLGLPAEVSGTLVAIGLSNFSNKQPAEVFDQFAQVDGGFTKTSIPLKNIFDSAPVSRSQAKRICQRLDAFQEVTLDFSGLDWMGQGFAHQIFVVFQNGHPDLVLRPINMSEGVAKMYRHVTAPQG